MGLTAGARTHTVSERKGNAKGETRGPRARLGLGSTASMSCACVRESDTRGGFKSPTGSEGVSLLPRQDTHADQQASYQALAGAGT
jgi:hypothetical protein